MAQYSQEQLWKIFEALPDELKDALLSEDTANTIREICQKNEVQEKDVPRMAAMVGDTLMGLLPPEDFSRRLEKELVIDKERAEKISQGVNRLILFPVKDSLVDFYKEISFAPGGRIIKPEMKEKVMPEIKKAKEREKKEKIPKKESSQADVYREPIE